MIDLLRNALGRVKPKDIAAAIGKKHDTVKKMLSRMAMDGQVLGDGDTGYYLRDAMAAPSNPPQLIDMMLR